jgi:hypothetical protein
MVLSCYLGKTSSNGQTMCRIIENRARQLVKDGNGLTDSWLETPLDSLEHLARVQALLVYQVMCLHDGEIRLRHLAESHIPVLNSWV